MRILIATYRYFVSSGPERYLFNITGQLERAGHTVMPFSIRYGQNKETDYSRYFVSPLAGEDEVYFAEHRKTPAVLAKTLSRLFYSGEVEAAVRTMAAETQPDVAYVLYYLRKLSPSLLVGLKKSGVPIVVRISDYGMFCPEHHCLRDGRPCTLCLSGNLWPSIRHACVKGSRAISAMEALATSIHRAAGFFSLVDRFVTTNPFMQEMMIRAGYAPERLICIPTFTDLQTFSPAGRTPTPRPYVLYVGRLDEPKGVHVLIEAMAGVGATLGPNAPELWIAGQGHEQDYVDRLHTLAGGEAAAQVRFLGHVDADKIPALMRDSLCVVMPALWYENLPNSVVESLACGTPVVASNIGSLATTITDNVDGLLCEPGHPASLGRAISGLARDPQLRSRLSAAARRTAEARHAPQTHLERLTGVFDEVTRSRTPREPA